MFGVIGLHWEQHHRIRHWSCLIGRSTCKSDSGRLHGLNHSLWPWSTNRIERAHIYMTLWQSITDKSRYGLNFYCLEHKWKSTVVASTYWNNWETITLLSKEKKGHTRYHMLHHLYELIGQLTLHRVHWCPLFHPHWFWKYFCIFFSSIGHFKKSLLKWYKSWTKTTKTFFVVLYITVQQITNNNVKTTTEKFKLSQQTAKQ